MAKALLALLVSLLSGLFSFRLSERSPQPSSTAVTPTTSGGNGLLRGDVSSSSSVVSAGKSKSCLGPPYLYVTMHAGGNILKYSRDGCLLSTAVLASIPSHENGDPIELRSMVIRSTGLSSATGQMTDELYVADAVSKDSRVLLYGSCNAAGQREFNQTVISSVTNPGVDHTYGLCFDDVEENMYISNQHTDNVLRFNSRFEPMPLPPSLVANSHYSRESYYPGSFVQFGRPRIHAIDEQGVRAVLVVGSELWIANEDLDGVAIAPLETGVVTNVVKIPGAIGLVYDPTRNWVFVTAKAKHRQSAIHAVDITSLRSVRTYRFEMMIHPTGVALYQDVMYVAAQVLGEILAFNITSAAFLGKVARHAPGELEQIVLSNC